MRKRGWNDEVSEILNAAKAEAGSPTDQIFRPRFSSSTLTKGVCQTDGDKAKIDR